MAKKNRKEKQLSERQILLAKLSEVQRATFEHNLILRFKSHIDFKEVELPRSNDYHGYIDQYGRISYNLYKLDRWAFTHMILHLAFGDFDRLQDKKIIPELWNKACCYCVSMFMSKLKIYNPTMQPDHNIGSDPERVYQRLLGGHFDLPLKQYGPNYDRRDMVWSDKPPRNVWGNYKAPNWQEIFARGLIEDASDALQIAAGADPDKTKKKTPGETAKQWFMTSYPLLGSVVSIFKIVEDRRLLEANNIDLAAVEPHQQTIYINTRDMDELQTRFVMAHEILHVALRDEQRQEFRDPYLWNVACDYRINAWLIEMGIGTLPDKDILYDPELKGLSAEAIYDRIVNDIRLFKKLGTLRGKGLVDIIPSQKGFWEGKAGTSLDEFYRSLLGQGYDFHQQSNRGFLPASLVDEVKAALMPPIPWDVQLARWFDEHIKDLERKRTFTKRSRRQAANPDIPMAAYYIPNDARATHTFGIVFDSSASMHKALIAKGLGTIVAYAQSKDVRQVRLVYADAQAYDQGYVAIDDLLGSVKVHGRGGTVLQPAVDLLLTVKDFPEEAPILIITDGWIDHLKIKRTHAYLLPKGGHLPYKPSGEVFYVE